MNNFKPIRIISPLDVPEEIGKTIIELVHEYRRKCMEMKKPRYYTEDHKVGKYMGCEITVRLRFCDVEDEY